MSKNQDNWRYFIKWVWFWKAPIEAHHPYRRDYFKTILCRIDLFDMSVHKVYEEKSGSESNRPVLSGKTAFRLLLLLLLIVPKVAAGGEISLTRQDGEDLGQPVHLGRLVSFICQIKQTASLSWTVRRPSSSASETLSFFTDDTPNSTKHSGSFSATLHEVNVDPSDDRFGNFISTLTGRATVALNGTHIGCIGAQQNSPFRNESTTLTVLDGDEEDSELDTGGGEENNDLDTGDDEEDSELDTGGGEEDGELDTGDYEENNELDTGDYEENNELDTDSGDANSAGVLFGGVLINMALCMIIVFMI